MRLIDIRSADLSRKRKRYFQCAYTAALASKGCGGKKSRFRLGAVITDRKTILSVRFNQMRTNPNLLRFYKYPFLHAESAAILALGMDNCEDCDIYICRILRNSHIAMAKPCDDCMALIKYVGIRNIYYTTEEGYDTIHCR